MTLKDGSSFKVTAKHRKDFKKGLMSAPDTYCLSICLVLMISMPIVINIVCYIIVCLVMCNLN